MHFFSKTNAWKMAWYIKIVQGCDCQGSQNEPRQEQLGPEAGWAAAQGRCLTQHCRVGGLPGARTATCRLWIKWHRMGSQASGAQTGFIILRPTDPSVTSVSALAPFFFLAWGKKKKKTRFSLLVILQHFFLTPTFSFTSNPIFYHFRWEKKILVIKGKESFSR